MRLGPRVGRVQLASTEAAAHAAFQARHGTAYWPDMRPALRATTEMAAQPPKKRRPLLRASDSEPPSPSRGQDQPCESACVALEEDRAGRNRHRRGH